jgi:hypothetical protein
MNNSKRCLVLGTVLLAPLASIHAQDRKPSEQELAQIVHQRTTELRRTQAAEKSHLEKLRSGIRGASSNQGAAADQHQKEIKDSVTKSGPALLRSLNRVDCRGGQCAVEFKLSQNTSGRARAQELFAIDDWAASSQPCAYTMVDEPIGSGPIQVFINCAP